MTNNKRQYAPSKGGEEVKPGTVANRSNGERRARRKKRGALSQTGIKLTVNEDTLDRDRYTYRFVKDSGARISQLEAEDWDKAPSENVLGSHSMGEVGTKVGGTDENGQPYDMVLMRKEKDWYEEDQAEKQKPLDEMEAAIRGGTAHQGKDKGLDASAYTPGANQISRD